jgi:hypothetical protein
MTRVRQSQFWPGLWSEVTAIVGNAKLLCVPCAKWRFGVASVNYAIEGVRERKVHTDQWGNTLSAVLRGSDDLHTECCGRCHGPLCGDDCICYEPEQAEYWREHGVFQYEECEVCGETVVSSPRYIRKGVCMDCRLTMPYLWMNVETGEWLD